MPFLQLFLLLSAKKDGSEYRRGGQEIGKSMAERSKGLFSADDWQCKRWVIFLLSLLFSFLDLGIRIQCLFSSCGNVNWARRMTCNMCNTAKFGKVEQRTGTWENSFY